VTGSRRTDIGCSIGVVLLAAVLLLWGVWSWPLSDPDAGMYADIGARMAASGDWITPRFNDLRYLEKPPLLYWLIASAYRLAGPSEWSAHLWPALAGVAGVAITVGIGRGTFGTSVGLPAGLILTTTIGYAVYSRVVSTDLLFTGFLSLALFAFWQEYRGHGRGWNLLLYVSIGLAVMTKGVIGVCLPGLIVVVFLALSGEIFALKRLLCLALAVMTKGFVGLFPLVVLATYGLLSGSFHALRGLASVWSGLMFSLLIVPWHLIMGWQHEGYFWHYFANEHILRFLGRRHPIDFISLPLPIFSLVLFLWLLPWSPYLALAIPRQWPQLRKPLPREDAGHLLMLLWASMFLLFFALSRARLPQYCLPAMPALALLIGMSLDKRYTGSISSTTGLLIATAISALLPALALLLLPSYLGHYHQLGLSDRAISLIRVVFGLMVGASALALPSFARRRWLGGLHA
jgi:4-amino-4-deoxy-L-arabinose transferase-like glycosyltransferase